MSIGAFAERTGLPVSALRFYAARNVLAPAEVDPSSGYRRYDEDQVENGRLIAALRRMDMPLQEIERTLRITPLDRPAVVAEHLRNLERVVLQAHATAQILGLVGDPSSEYPNREVPMARTTLMTDDFLAALEQVLPAVATDPDYPDLMGVLLEGADRRLRVVATDTHRLAVREVGAADLDADFSAFISRRTAEAWRDRLDAGNSAELIVDQDGVEIRVGDMALNARALAIEFPDYRRLLDDGANPTVVSADRSHFLVAIETFSGSEPVFLDTSDTNTTVRRQGVSMDVDAAVTGPERSIALNPTYVADAVSATSGDQLVVEIDEALKPVTFRSAEDQTAFTKIMPVHLPPPG